MKYTYVVVFYIMFGYGVFGVVLEIHIYCSIWNVKNSFSKTVPKTRDPNTPNERKMIFMKNYFHGKYFPNQKKIFYFQGKYFIPNQTDPN